MKFLHLFIRKLDKGRSDFSTGLELALGALVLVVALRVMPIW